MAERLIYIIGSDFTGISQWMNGRQTHSLKDADLVVIGCGNDIHVMPALYGEKAHLNTKFDETHDAFNIQMLKLAVKYKKKILGVEYGGNLVSVLNNCRLIQYQENDYHLHAIGTYDGVKLLTPSHHTQACYPWELDKSDYKILAHSRFQARKHLSGAGEEMVTGKIENDKEIEIIYFPKTNCISMEADLSSMYAIRDRYPYLIKTIAWHQELLNKFLDGRLEKETKDLN